MGAGTDEGVFLGAGEFEVGQGLVGSGGDGMKELVIMAGEVADERGLEVLGVVSDPEGRAGWRW